MLILAASVRGGGVGRSDESKRRKVCSDDTAVTDLKFFFVTAVLMTWIVIQLYNSIYCSIFGPVQKLQKHRLFSSFSSLFFFLLTSLWFANKILMIHGFNIAVCMCDDFSTPTIKSLPSLVSVLCRHWQISLFVSYKKQCVHVCAVYQCHPFYGHCLWLESTCLVEFGSLC